MIPGSYALAKAGFSLFPSSESDEFPKPHVHRSDLKPVPRHRRHTHCPPRARRPSPVPRRPGRAPPARPARALLRVPCRFGLRAHRNWHARAFRIAIARTGRAAAGLRQFPMTPLGQFSRVITGRISVLMIAMRRESVLYMYGLRSVIKQTRRASGSSSCDDEPCDRASFSLVISWQQRIWPKVRGVPLR